jgi:4-hydroxyphenylpyruvate dioxygenase-like putative hemolysin
MLPARAAVVFVEFHPHKSGYVVHFRPQRGNSAEDASYKVPDLEVALAHVRKLLTQEMSRYK